MYCRRQRVEAQFQEFSHFVKGEGTVGQMTTMIGSGGTFPIGAGDRKMLIEAPDFLYLNKGKDVFLMSHLDKFTLPSESGKNLATGMDSKGNVRNNFGATVKSIQ